jgi:hypothetical protein
MQKIAPRKEVRTGRILYYSRTKTGENTFTTEGGSASYFPMAVKDMQLENLNVEYTQEKRIWDFAKEEFCEKKRDLVMFYPHIDVLTNIEQRIRQNSEHGKYFGGHLKKERSLIQEAIGGRMDPSTPPTEMRLARDIHEGCFGNTKQFDRYYKLNNSMNPKNTYMVALPGKFEQMPLYEYCNDTFVWYLPFLKSSVINKLRRYNRGWFDTRQYVVHRVHTNLRLGIQYVVPIKVQEILPSGAPADLEQEDAFTVDSMLIQEDLVQGPYSLFGTTDQAPADRFITSFLNQMYQHMGVFQTENIFGKMNVPNHEHLHDQTGTYNELLGVLHQKYYAKGLSKGINMEGDNPTLPYKYVHGFLTKTFYKVFLAITIRMLEKMADEAPDHLQMDRDLWKNWIPAKKLVKINSTNRVIWKPIHYSGFTAKQHLGAVGVAMHFGLKPFDQHIYEEYALQMSPEALLPLYVESRYNKQEKPNKQSTIDFDFDVIGDDDDPMPF